tara:strand:+ start:4526 stop:5296 length:771 start_codon:yes stop_codon:yes gene_type:complete
MKVVILAGGFGTRISEETHLKPKPMITIGGKPILWHIIKLYNFYGLKDFVICCGYKGYLIKEYFANYFLHMNDLKIDLKENKIEFLQKKAEDWRISLIDTGLNTMTGGRLKRVADYLDNEDFCLTYGDGLSDIDIKSLVNNHKASKKLATVTAVKPKGRYGSLSLGEKDNVDYFEEKNLGNEGWVSAGFFVLNPKVINRIEGDSTVWEQGPMKSLVNDNQLNAFKHNGFWQPMDTLREKVILEKLWNENRAPWKKW